MADPPDNRRYTSSHEWALLENGLVVVGLTDHAVQELSDLVFIDLPEDGAKVTAGTPFGEIESVKAVSELNTPASGTVVEVNREIEDSLDTIVESPYEEGWLIKIRPSDKGELDGLMSGADYAKYLKE